MEKSSYLLAIGCMFIWMLSVTTVKAETLFNETIGAAATTTEIVDYNGWYNFGSVNYSGTADARSTYSSTGDYTGASGAGNIYFVGADNDYFQISGINTRGYRNIRLSLALYKANATAATGNAENGSNFMIRYSVDSGQSWKRIPITIPTGTGTTEIYYWRDFAENLPATDNLTLCFTNIGATEPVHFRLDDVTLTGDKDNILNETIGSGAANTAISAFAGWANSSPLVFSGTGFVRNDLPSTGKYTGATGGGNVFLNAGQYFQISGINASGYILPVLSVGVMKASTADNGSRLLMTYSTNGVNWSTPQQCNTTASGSNLWYRKHFSGLPAAANLYLKFNNTSTVGGSFRLDDLRLFSSLNAPVIGFPTSYSLSATSATLSANIIGINGANVTQRGFYYSTTANFADGSGTIVSEAVTMSEPGSFSLTTGVLLPNTVYYFKAFATSSSGTSYSGQNTFSTLPVSTTTVFTLNNTLPTGGSNFQTYGDAVTYLNANFAASSTGFTFLMKDGQEFADTSTNDYFITASGTTAKQIIFQRDNSGSTRPKLSRTSTSNNVVVLSGADWVTFDGIDVRVAGNYGYHLVNNGASTTNGSQHNTIKNCIVTGGGFDAGYVGVSHTYSATPTSEAGKHSYNVFQNITVTGIKNGIFLNGVASEIEISGCTITDIGSTLYCSGIKTTNITNLRVFNNIVSDLFTASNYPIGINIATCKGIVEVFNNKVSGLVGYYDVYEPIVIASGIQVIPASEESDIRIYNNMIWNSNYIPGYTGVMMLRGIFIDTGTINGSLSIDFNTIRIKCDNCIAAGIKLSSPSANIRNNVISMNSTSQTYNYYGIYYDNLSQLNGFTDSNVIYLSNPAMGRYIYAAGTTYTLEAWQNATGRESASWIYDPRLISTNDLHITPGADTPVESNASYYSGSISWVTDDIDGDPRSSSTPDIGADEGAFTFIAPQIPSNPISFTATGINPVEFTLSATANASGNPILVAFNTSNTFGIPGGLYSAGAAIQGGGTVLHVGNAADLGLVPGFSPSATYYFKAWSYASTERTTCYTYSSGITVIGTTTTPINFPSVITVNPSISGAFNYDSLSRAIHEVELGIVPTGGLTINVSAGYAEILTSPLIINLTGTSTKPITIQKDPATNGANPLFTRNDSGSISTSVMGGYGDSMIKIEGSDYLTIDGIDLVSTDAGIEYGFLLHKPSPTNGSQYLIIRNCTLNMTKGSSPYVTGIYIGNGTTSTNSKIGHIVTATSGENRYVKVTGTVVLNAHTGIHIQGSGATGYWDNHITIGQLGPLNQIISFGGVADSTSYGVVFYNVTDPTVTSTNIDNSLSPAAGDVFGIYIRGLVSKEAGEASAHLNMVEGDVLISDNYIKMANTSVGRITNWIKHYNTCNSETITNNNFAAGVISSQGNNCLISATNQCITKTISGNATSGTITMTGIMSYFSAYENSLTVTFGHSWEITEVISNNNFSNIISTGGGIISGFYALDSSLGSKTFFGNTLSNWSTQGEFAGISAGNEQSVEVYNNFIYDITASLIWSCISIAGGNDGILADCYDNALFNMTMTGSGTLIGIAFANGVATGNCYNNKLFTLSATHPDASVVGLMMSEDSTLKSIYNNMIYGLSAQGSDTASGTPTVTGIKYGGSGIGNIFYNTVYLNDSSTAAGYSSAALYHVITSSQAVTGTYSRIRNNIFVNKSAPGSLGKSVAFWKETSGDTAMGASSDRNIYYAGEPDANNLIAYLGTTACPTLLEYKGEVVTVDQASFTEDVPFLSTSGNIDVHINPNIPTYVQNQGTAISGFTTDIDGQTRGTSTPDIGADEGSFTPVPASVAPSAQPTNLILIPNYNSVSIQFTPSVAQAFLVIRHTTATPSATPVNGTSYWAGQTFGNSTVISATDATTCLATGLSSSTQYYFSVYAYNTYGFPTPKYQTTSPLRLAVTTLSASHNQPSAFTAIATNTTSIALSVSPNAAGDNIIVAYSSDPSFGTPFGNYTMGDTINGGGTILYMGSAAGLNSHNGIYPWSRVYYKAWSYYLINRTTYYTYSNGITANARTLIDPLVGTKTVNPNIYGANNFISISEAVAALNYAGVGTGGVTINIVAGYVDSRSAQLVFTTAGNATSPVVFQKDPATTGANPLIYRSDGGSLGTSIVGGDGDCIVRIEGSDYLTFDGIDVQSGNAAIEYGYFATKPSETNGCQNLSIKNCTITMTRATAVVVAGIYISNAPTLIYSSNGFYPTDPSGQNKFVTITGNTIRNTSFGIVLIGSFSSGYPDTDYTIGAEGSGNIIENFNGQEASGIYVKYVNNPAICYNSINNLAGGGLSNNTTISGINLTMVTGEIVANYNSIFLSLNNNYNIHSSYWIRNTGTGIRESYIGNIFGTGSASTYYSGTGYFLYLSSDTPIRIATDNTSLVTAQDCYFGDVYAYYSSNSGTSGMETITNNNFYNTFRVGGFTGIYMKANLTGDRICSGNTISGWIAGANNKGIYLNSTSSTPSVISNNIISNQSGAGVVGGIEVTTSVSEIYGNAIDNLNGTGPEITGIRHGSGSSICHNNQISNLNGTSSNSIVRGLFFNCSSEIYNNIIHSLSAVGSDETVSQPNLAAIVTDGNSSTSTHQIYHNSVWLNSTATGTTFSSAGLLLKLGIHDIRNNSIVNNCIAGSSGRTVAIWKYYSNTVIAATSNNNIYNAGVISTSAPYRYMIGYFNGVVKSTLVSYQTSVSPAEQNSYTEDVPYASTTGTIDLHINPDIATYVESRAVPIAGYETDFDGQTRNNVASDIGADEGHFTPNNLPPLPVINQTPVDLASEQLCNVSLSWGRGTSGATPHSFNVYFGITNPPVLIDNVTSLSYSPGALTVSQTYYWKIDPINDVGAASSFFPVPVLSFTTHNPLPEAAVLVSPASGATGIAINPSLNWTAGTGFAPLGYKLYLGTDNPPTNVIDGTDLGNVTSYTHPSGRHVESIGGNNVSFMAIPSLFKSALNAMLSRNSLSYNTTYYWKVVPYTLAGNAENNAVWSFATELPPVPNVAINPTPADMSINQPLQSFIGWGADPVGTEPDSYNVYFGTTNPPPLIGSQTSTSFNAGTLDYSTTYYWMIDAHSVRGYSSSEHTLPVWSFTTIPAPYPTPAVAVNPLNGATNVSLQPTLQWNAGAGATPTGYLLAIGTDNPPSNLINYTNLGNVLSYPVPELTPNTTYYWHVLPYTEAGSPSENIIWSFTTSAATVEVGNGTAPFNAPLSSAYGYVRDVSLYLSSELTGLAQPVNSLAWYATQNDAVNKPVKIYLKPGSDEGLISETWDTSLMGATLVYDGAINNVTANSWLSIPLSNPFTLPAGSALVVMVETNYGGTGNGDTVGGGFLSTLDTWYRLHRVIVSNNTPPTNTGSFWGYRNNIRISHLPTPSPAVIVSPASGATDVSRLTSLNWIAGLGEPTGYRHYLGTDGNGLTRPGNIISNLDLSLATTYSPEGLVYSTTYYWQVVPYNAMGDAVNCPIWSFTTGLSPIPYVAINPSPADQTTLASINTQLSWSPNPVGIAPIGYNIYFGTTYPPQLTGNQASTSYNPGVLSYGTTYYWAVDPQSAEGYCSQQYTLQIWSFTTEQSLYPAQAILVSPANGSSNATTGTSLNWSAGAGATPTGYRIYLGTNNPPTNLLNGLDVGIVTTCNPAGLTTGNTYYWQVVAYNALGDAPPSPVWSFSVTPQSVTIGTGTGTNRSPFGTAYGYERDATLYTAAEIGSLAQPIRSLAWYATRSVSTGTPIKVYLKATSATALPSANWTTTITGATLVYNSTVSSISANAWMNLTLSSAFTLASGSNLMVLIETNYGGSGSGNSNGGGFRNSNLSPDNTKHKYWQANTTPPTTTGSFDILRANIRLSSSTTVVNLPSPAMVTAPASGDLNVPLTTSLNWSSGGGTVTGYRLYLGTDGNGTSTPSNLVYGLDLGTSLSYTHSVAFAYDTTYYWKVVPYNSAGAAPGSSIWSFTTELPPVPYVAFNPVPADLAANVMIDSELSWSHNPIGVIPTGYKLYLGTDNPPNNILNGLDLGNVTTFSGIGILLYNTTYYWKVVAYNANGESTANATWSFTTETESISNLTPPTNLVISVQSGNVLLSWDAVPDATSYKIYSSIDPNTLDWGLPIGNTGLTEFTDFAQGSCFYRVIATSEPPTRNAPPAFLPAKAIITDQSGK